MALQGLGLMLGFGGALMGGLGAQQEKASEAKMHNKAVKQQYKQDKKNYKYQWKQTKRLYEYQKDEVENAKRNNATQVNYQNETNKQNWNHQLAIDDYEYQEKKNAYAKSMQTYDGQIDFNKKAEAVAIKSIDNVLGEKFLQTAFDNQQMVNDFFTMSGNKEFEKAATSLGLQTAQDQAGYETSKSIAEQNQSLKQTQLKKAQSFKELSRQANAASLAQKSLRTEAEIKQGDAEFSKSSSKLNFEDALTAGRFTKAESIQELENQRQQTGIAKAGLGLELQQSAQEFKISQKQNSLALSKLRAEQAFESDKLALESLQAKGQARLNQAGVSAASSVVSVLSSLGQQQTAIVDSMVREEEIALAAMEEAANVKDIADSKTAIEGAKVDQSLFDNVAKAKLQLQRADDDLTIAGKKTDLEIGQLDKNIRDVAEVADQDIKKSRVDFQSLADLTAIEQDMYDTSQANAKESSIIDRTQIGNKLKSNKAEAALSDKKINWNLLEETNKLQLNQEILSKMLDSAVAQSKIDKEKVGTDKYEADIIAKANLMLKPTRGPKAPQPLELPYATYLDPLKPKKPPKPKKGISMSGSGGAGMLGTIGSMMSSVGGMLG